MMGSTILLAIVQIAILSIITVNGFVEERCAAGDQKCIHSAAQEGYKRLIAGDPSVGAECLEPCQVDVNQGNVMGLDYKFTQCNLAGLSNCTVKSVYLNKEASRLTTELFCPSLRLHGNYNLKGYLFYLKEVFGDGTFGIDCKDYIITINAVLAFVRDSKGDEFPKIISHEADAHSRGLVFDFKNLYNGDQKRSDETHNLCNALWGVMDMAFTKPVLDPHMDEIIKMLNKLLQTIKKGNFYKKN